MPTCRVRRRRENVEPQPGGEKRARSARRVRRYAGKPAVTRGVSRARSATRTSASRKAPAEPRASPRPARSRREPLATAPTAARRAPSAPRGHRRGGRVRPARSCPAARNGACRWRALCSRRWGPGAARGAAGRPGLGAPSGAGGRGGRCAGHGAGRGGEPRGPCAERRRVPRSPARR